MRSQRADLWQSVGHRGLPIGVPSRLDSTQFEFRFDDPLLCLAVVYEGTYAGTAHDTDEDDNPITYPVDGTVGFTVDGTSVKVTAPYGGQGTIGGGGEAAIVEEMLGDPWRATPGADRWLTAHSPPVRRGKRRRR